MEAHLKSVETARLASKMEQDKKNKEKKAQEGNAAAPKTTDHEMGPVLLFAALTIWGSANAEA